MIHGCDHAHKFDIYNMLSWSSIAKRLNMLEAQTATINKANFTENDSGWYCAKSDCLYGGKGLVNYASRRCCNGCYRPRAVAERPDLQPQVRPQRGAEGSFEQSATEKEKKKREARTKKRKDKLAARQAWKNAAAPRDPIVPAPAPVAAIPSGAPGPVATAMTATASIAAPTVKYSKLAIPDDLKARLPLLDDAMLKVVTDSLALELIPSQVEAKSPEAILIKTLGDRGPAANVAKVSELQTSIGAYKSMIITAQAGGDSMSEMEVVLKEKLEATEVALTKAQKDAPSQLSELKAVQESRSSYELTAQTRKDLQQKGITKAGERKVVRHAYIRQLKEQLDLLDVGITKLEDENNAAHAARAATLNEVDNKVLALFDAKIAALQQPAPQGPIPAGPGPADQLALPSTAPPAPMPSTLAELEAARKQIEELQTKMQLAANIVVQQFEQRFEEIQVDMLPPTRVPEEKHLASMGSTYEVLNSWHIAGAGNPFDWDTLDTLVGPGLEAPSVARELLGDTLWKKWYPDALPGGAAVVLQQLALIIHQCLANIKQSFETAKEKIAPLAVKGNAIVRDSSKRLRTQ